jgi:hypothetical protein
METDTTAHFIALDGSEFAFDPARGEQTYKDNDAAYTGDGQHPPFAVFDVDEQENIAHGLPTLNSAEKIYSMIARSGAYPCTLYPNHDASRG